MKSATYTTNRCKQCEHLRLAGRGIAVWIATLPPWLDRWWVKNKKSIDRIANKSGCVGCHRVGTKLLLVAIYLMNKLGVEAMVRKYEET